MGDERHHESGGRERRPGRRPEDVAKESPLNSPARSAPPSPEPETGTLDALAGLYREHCERVLAAAHRITGNPMDAEDVLQTVFLRLLRREDDLELGETAPAYFHRAAVNAALDALRRRQRQRAVDVDDVAPVLADDSLPGPERTRSGKEATGALRAALARLSPASAEIFALRYFEEYKNRDIARLLGMTQTAVAVSLHRTRNRLQSELARHYSA